MGTTMLDQIATNRALYEAARGGNHMGDVSAMDALRSAALIQRQVTNADGYSYRGRSYGSFVASATDIALESSLLLQDKKLAYTLSLKQKAMYNISNSKKSYSYAGGSYGQFIDKTEQESKDAMQAAQIIEGTQAGNAGGQETPAEEAPKATEEKGIKAFLKKYKLWVIAAVCAALYFVLRKKD